MTRYFFVILIMALIGVAIVVKAGVTMFAERQYWQGGARRFTLIRTALLAGCSRSFRKRKRNGEA